MKAKTNELIGKALDYTVARAVGATVVYRTGGMCCDVVLMDVQANKPWSPSTNWEQGGPLIEQFCTRLSTNGDRSGPDPDTGKGWYDDPHVWSACVGRPFGSGQGYSQGKTALIATMRAIVDANFGMEVDVPEVLL